MRKGDIRAGDNRAPNSMIEFVEGNELILQPGIFESEITVDLVQVDGVEVNTLIVITHDGACAPVSGMGTVFILQFDPERDLFQLG